MKYTIGKISKLFRISTDTLRHYDRLGLLKPNIDVESGYRYYEMKHLQQLDFILRAKYLEIPLSEVKDILDSEDLSKYDSLLLKQQEIIKEKINHLEKLNIILSKSKKDLDEVMSFRKNYDFENIKILNKPINYYTLTVKEYMEDINIMNILGDICDENFDSPHENNIEDEEFRLYTIENQNQIIKDEKYVYLLETPKNKEPLDNYFLSKYNKIPVKKIDGNYISVNFYGSEEDLKEYLILLNNHFNKDTKKDILVRFKFYLYKKINPEYYWQILYQF